VVNYTRGIDGGGCCSSVSPANLVARIPLQRETEMRHRLLLLLLLLLLMYSVSVSAAFPLSRENRSAAVDVDAVVRGDDGKTDAALYAYIAA